MKKLIILSAALAGASLSAGGFGLGVQTAFDLGSGRAIAPRVDFLHATDSATAGPVSLSATSDILSVGADFDWFTSGRTGEGFFLQAGLGLAGANLAVSGSAPGASASTTSRQGVLYPEAGLGWQFNRHFGLELLYKAIDFRDVNLTVGGVPATFSYSPTLELGLIVRL